MNKFFGLALIAFFSLSIIACKDKPKGEAAKTEEAAKVATASGSSYSVDATTSKVMWIGTKPAGSHNGTVNVSEGSISVDNGTVSAGKFTIDMNSITCLDLTGDEKLYLEAHLKGTSEDNATDFFNVTKFPTASFEISKVTGLEGTDGVNSIVYGNLTIKDITKQIAFKANIDVSNDMVKVTSNQFTINRTDWDIKYGSKTFFDNLKDKFIEDNMGMSINLVANKS